MSNIERKLASLRAISEILPIPEADNLELCIVDGWKVVAQKGLYKKNDYVIYFEIDSFLPIHPEFEFLRKSSYRNVEGYGEGFRIKTVKLRGQISQGLLMPLEILHKFTNKEYGLLNIGDDFTKVLNVTKWDPPVNSIALGADQAGLFPYFIPKTDQERVQNIFVDLKKNYENDYFEKSLKLDGTSMTVFINEDKVGVCSRNYELKEGDNTYWTIVKKLEIDKKLKTLGRNIAIQGELMGPGIQKNREQFKEHKFFVFNVYDIDTKEFLLPEKRRELVAHLNLTHVPILETNDKFKSSIEEYLEASDIKSIHHNIAEGVVYKHTLRNDVSFKCINNRYLLSEKD